MDDNEYTVGAAAELTGVSVRTLHHYDQIGLLQPTRRNPAGYRLYSADDLERLQRIVFYRELGFELADIAGILEDPAITDEDHLRRQHDLLGERIERFRQMRAVIDKELAARAAGISLTPAQRHEVFGNDKFVEQAAAARDEWGVQREERTARYSKEDWLELRASLTAIHRELAEAMLSGVPADDPRAMDLAERHRQHTDKWFHDCDYATHLELAAHYRDNRRRGRNYDDMVPGLSRYVHDAIKANYRVRGAG
jgi:DNA-binding transcriptional MerR regulator